MDIIGVLLVARYGLPPSEVRRGGGAYLLVGKSTERLERELRFGIGFHEERFG